jgi:23S rRNA (adenine-N6)-dimethyltransferase
VRAAGAAAPQRWGWHPLSAPAAARLVADAGIGRGDLVLDIGAGTGALTSALLAAGARVLAVELHPGRAGELRRRFDGRVTVIQTDAADLRLPRRPFRVVANPPWAISAAVVKRLTSRGSRLERADLVLPRWAVRRWSGERNGYELTGSNLPPRAFTRAASPAAVLVITPRAARR